MATARIPILNAMSLPDATGECFFQPIDVGLSIANNVGQMVLTMTDPTADTGVYGSFRVPPDYSSGGTVVLDMAEDGASAGNKGFGMSFVARADGESVDAAWDNTVNWTKAGTNSDEVMDTTSQAMTSLTTAAAEQILFYLFRDFSEDAFVGDLHLLGAYFEYTTA